MQKIIINKNIGAVILLMLFCFIMVNDCAFAQIWPISGSSGDFADTPTSPFGIRRLSADQPYDHHEGLDLAAYYDPVYAVDDGWIYEMKANDGSAGNWVLVGHNSYPDMSLYMHLDSWCEDLEVNWPVYVGEQIATSGWSGMPDASYSHLHFGYIGWDANYNMVGLAGPRWNPVYLLPYWNSTCPSLFNENFSVYYDPVTQAIDYMTFTTYSPADELDFADIMIWLYANNDYEIAWIYMDDYYSRGDNNADNAQWHGNFTFFAGNSNLEVSIQCRPRNYSTYDSYHIIDWTVNPVNNTIFPDENWLGVSVEDIDYDCEFYYSANWGNTTGLCPKIVVSEFWAKYDNNKVEIGWIGTQSDDLIGLHLLRSQDTLSGYERITEEPLNIDGDNRFIDDNIGETGCYYYKYELLYADGRAVRANDFASVNITLPEVFSLSQNYPNPFNMNTRIEYSLTGAEAGSVRFDIYDILGRKVRTVIDEYQEAGFYHVFWDGNDDNGNAVGSGIYFYKLSAANNEETRKMMVIK
ncbi:MAG: peptidoglycan DD-metalloendopeptidase family protein [Candidatus Zixiibacteriota bacterium]